MLIIIYSGDYILIIAQACFFVVDNDS